jgi:hypothetical protein
VATSCGTAPTVYLERDVVRIVVLPPGTSALDAEAWRAYWSELIQGVASRGYEVIPPEAVEGLFASKRIPLSPEVARGFSSQELARWLGADGVLWAHITQYTTSYFVALAGAKIEGDFDLEDGKTGEILWKTHEAGSMENRLEGSGREAWLSALRVAGSALQPDPLECWKRCVAAASQNLPRSGRDPEGASRRPALGENSAQPEGAEPARHFVVDPEGWTLAELPGFLLLSNMPGKIEEIDGGFVHQSTPVAHNRGLCVFSGHTGTRKVSFDGLPPGWREGVLPEFRRELVEHPDLTLRAWISGRLLRFPSKAIQALVE